MSTKKQLMERIAQLESHLKERVNWPDKCPITRRDFFMEIDGIPTYGGPYDSYTIPEMDGKPTDEWHERELFVRRYDHDEGGWLIGEVEVIPLRIINEDYLYELQDAYDELQKIKGDKK